MREHAKWAELEDYAARCCDRQSSNIFTEASLVAESYGGMAIERAADADSRPAVHELPRYRLVLGYNTVPRFIECYSSGLSCKLSASHEVGLCFCSFLCTEVGSLK
jgi:hypothetical protein